MGMNLGMMMRVTVGLGMIIGSVAIGGKWVEKVKDMQNVVRGRGWDVGSWSAPPTYRVGDKIWFTYSSLQGKIVELKTKEEYESCDMSNPIKMYTDGIDTVSLEEEGIRYFVSSNSENCKNGLKLHVEVLPPQPSDSADVITSEGQPSATAAGPISSVAIQIGANSGSLMAAIFLFYIFQCLLSPIHSISF